MGSVKKVWKNRILLLLVFIGVSVAFLTVFSLATSFFYDNGYVAWDSDVFLAMGKFADEGLVPYKDFFDHKGPFIIFIEWMGFLLGGKTGVFGVQVVFLTVSLIGIYKICRLYCTEKLSLWLTAFSLLILNMYFDKGNLTEEFCLPFLVWSTYVAVKSTSENSYGISVDKMSWKGVHTDYLLYGVTFMVGAMTRLTNSLPVVVLVVVCILVAIRNKQWKNLCVDLLWFVVGNLVVLVPTVIYFLGTGTLKEMVYATFIYNFKHGFERNTLAGVQVINMIVLAVPLVVVLVAGIMAIKKSDWKREGLIVVLNSGIAILLVVISRPYPHYLMIWIPAIVLGMVLMTRMLKVKSTKGLVMWGLIVVVAIGKVGTVGLDIYSAVNSNVGEFFDAEAREIVSGISKEDADKVIGYNVRARFYLETDILPCYKNFTFQGIHTRVDDVERREFENDLASLEAKYIVTGMSDSVYSQWIEEHYELEKSTKIFRLFVRK